MNITEFALLAIDNPEEARKVLEMVGRNVLKYDSDYFEKVSTQLDVPNWVEVSRGFGRVGQKVSMIKCIREHTGLGLRDSKFLADVFMEGDSNLTPNEVTDKYVSYFTGKK